MGLQVGVQGRDDLGLNLIIIADLGFGYSSGTSGVSRAYISEPAEKQRNWRKLGN